MFVFTKTEMCKMLQNLVKEIGFGRLGITPEEVGTHLAKASFAMALILRETPVFEVILVRQ